MTAFNILRMRPKPGQEDAFIENHRQRKILAGSRGFCLVKTGEREYFLIGEWESPAAIEAARPQLTKNMEVVRDLLEDLGGGAGVLDLKSGETVLEVWAE